MSFHLALFFVEPSSLQFLHALSGIKDNNLVSWMIVGVLILLMLFFAIVFSIILMVCLLVVFHFFCQVLGTQTASSNQILMGFGFMMTWFLMQFVMVAVNQQAIQSFQQGQILGWQVVEKGVQSSKQFMLHYAREKDLALFVNVASVSRPKISMDLSMRVVVLAYMFLELKAGFQIGVIFFLSFLLVDLVVASVIIFIGML